MARAKSSVPLTSLQIDPEVLADRIVAEAAESLFVHLRDNYGKESIREAVDKLFRAEVEKNINAVVGPLVKKGIKEFVFEVTNQYGEKKGEPQTFTEYLVGTANEWLHTPVKKYDGTPMSRDSYEFKRGDTVPQITYLISRYLYAEVEKAMKEAVGQINKQIAPALAEVVKTETANVIAKITKQQQH